jgi:hypothetical protein
MSTQPTLLEDPRPHDTGCKRLLKVPLNWHVELSFSGPNYCYRDKLTQIWNSIPKRPRLLMWLLQNPSGAGTQRYITDATVSKCARIAKRLGYDGIIIVNVCAYRATNNKELLKVADPVGPLNHATILEMAARADRIIVAHGKLPGRLQVHADTAVKLLRDAGYELYALEIGKSGPKHPLFLSEALQPIPYPERMAA